MWVRWQKLLQTIPQLEESDKAATDRAARDLVMRPQTSIFFQLGIANKDIMALSLRMFNDTMGRFKADLMHLISRYQSDAITANWRFIANCAQFAFLDVPNSFLFEPSTLLTDKRPPFN
jgi:hypothetical protein